MSRDYQVPAGIGIAETGTRDYQVPAGIGVAETTAVGGYTLKTVNGLVSTSIKTIQTLARASVKTYDGLTPP